MDGAIVHGCGLLLWKPFDLAMMTSLSRDAGELSAGKGDPVSVICFRTDGM